MTALGDAEMLGARALRYFGAHTAELVGLCVAFALAGALASFMIERPHVARAVIQVGLRASNDLIEDRLVACKRLEGTALALGEPLGRVEVEATPLADGNPSRPDRLVELTVRADTASVASTVLHGAIERVLALHRQLHDHDLAINREQIERLNAEAAALEAQLETDLNAEKGELAEVLYILRREANGYGGWLTPSRAPPTMLISADPSTARASSRLPLLALAGAALGLMIGVLLMSVRRLANAALDPITLALFRFLARYGRVLIVSAVLGALAGAGAAMLRPTQWTARSVVRSALGFPDGPVEAMEPAAMRLRNHLEVEAMKAATAGPRAKVDVQVINVSTAPLVASTMFEMTARSPDPSASTAHLLAAIRTLQATQDPTVEAERTRLEAEIAAYERQLAKRPASGRTAHEARGFLDLARELANSRRTAAPSRTRPTEILLGPVVLPDGRARGIVTFAVLGLIAGLLIGATASFVAQSFRATRG